MRTRSIQWFSQTAALIVLPACAHPQSTTPPSPIVEPPPVVAAPTSCSDGIPSDTTYLRTATRCVRFVSPLVVYRLTRGALVGIDFVGRSREVITKDLSLAHKPWLVGEWRAGRAVSLVPTEPDSAKLETFAEVGGLLVVDGEALAPAPSLRVIARIPHKGVRAEGERRAFLALTTKHVLGHLENGDFAGCEHTELVTLTAGLIRTSY